MKLQRSSRALLAAGSSGLLALTACLSACVTVDAEPERAAPPNPELEALRTIAEDPDVERRLAAVERIESQALILWLATGSEDEALARAAARRIADESGCELALRERPSLAPWLLPRIEQPARLARLLIQVELDPATLPAAVERLPIGPLLMDVARRAPVAARLLCIDRLTHPLHLRELALRGKTAEERRRATLKLDNRSLLAAIARRDASVEVRLAAVNRIRDRETLERIAGGDDVLAVRLAALLRIESRYALGAIAGGGYGSSEDEEPSVTTAVPTDPADALVSRAAGWVLALRAPLLARELDVRFVAEPGATELTLTVQRRGEPILVERLRADTDLAPLLGRLLDELDPTPPQLSELARHDSRFLKRACLRRGLPRADVVRLATSDKLASVRGAALVRLDPTRDRETLIRIAKRDAVDWVAVRALDRIEDPSAVARVALEAGYRRVRRRATQRVTDPEVLRRVATQDRRPDVRSTAIRRISDGELLAAIARDDLDRAVRYNAVAALRDPAALLALEAEEGTLGRLAACRRGLLELEAEVTPRRLRLILKRGNDDVLYRIHPEPLVIRGEWIRGTVSLLEAPESDRAPAGPERGAATVVWIQEWAMPTAISGEEPPDWLDPVIDPATFLEHVRSTLALHAEAADEPPAD